MVPTSAPSRVTGRPGRREWPLDGNRDKAALHQSAVFRARGQFLAHVAAFGPGHAVQFVEPRLQQHRLLDFQVTRAVRQTKSKPVAIPIDFECGRWQWHRGQQAPAGLRAGADQAAIIACTLGGLSQAT